MYKCCKAVCYVVVTTSRYHVTLSRDLLVIDHADNIRGLEEMGVVMIRTEVYVKGICTIFVWSTCEVARPTA